MPGYIDYAFMSQDGRNLAFIKKKKYKKEKFGLKIQKRYELMQSLIKKSVENNLSIIKVEGKSKTFYINKFIIISNAPKLIKHIKKNEQNEEFINLSQFSNTTINEFIQFLYLNITLTTFALHTELTMR